MIENTLLIAAYCFLPALVLILCRRFEFLNKLGAVVLSYAIGLILGLSGVSAEKFHGIQEVLMSATVPLAIPLLLFSSNVRAWKKLAVQPFYSLVFALIAVVFSVLAGFYLFKGPQLQGFDKIGGMLVGLYSGGTPNLASLKLMLHVDEETYLAVHTYDMVIGTLYLFLLMGFGRRLFGWILPSYKSTDTFAEDGFEEENLGQLLKSKLTRWPLLRTLLISVLMVAMAGGVMLLVPVASQMVVFIFIITALGIWGSSVRRIHSVRGTFDLGMYLILVFSIVVASKVTIGNLSDVNPSIFGYITFVVFVSLFLHVLLARLRNIDSDTVIITSTALLCSPPFVPVVAGSLRNKSIILPGLTIGLIGYALGNYLGYLMAVFLAWLQ